MCTGNLSIREDYRTTIKLLHSHGPDVCKGHTKKRKVYI